MLEVLLPSLCGNDVRYAEIVRVDGTGCNSNSNLTEKANEKKYLRSDFGTVGILSFNSESE